MGNERAKPRFWMRRLFKEREKKGLYNILVKDLKLHDTEYFFKSFRMTPSQLDLLRSWIAPSIVKSSLKRSVAGTEERLCIALRYLVTGDAQVTISTSYRHSPPTIGRIVQDVCRAIWNALRERGILKIPSSKTEWLDIARDFENRWNFPHCLGAIDGKHVVIQAPKRSGSVYFNYKFRLAYRLRMRRCIKVGGKHFVSGISAEWKTAL